MEHTASASISLAHHAGAESTPSHRFGCGTGGHAARDDDHARGPALESDERTRGTRRGTGEGECAAGADRRAERRVGGGPRRGRPGVGGGTAAGDRLNEQVEALSAEVVRAEKQAEAVVGRAERAEAGRDAERAGADALRDRVEALQAQLAQLEAEGAGRSAQAGPGGGPGSAAQRRQSCGRRMPSGRARGLLARLRAAWRGE